MSTCLSAVPPPEACVVVFDLDDTLYPEREFVRSGFRAVADWVAREMGAEVRSRLFQMLSYQQHDPFGTLICELRLPIEKQLLVRIYHEHTPDLALTLDVARLLTHLRDSGCDLGIITDGRSTTQRNKIQALGLAAWCDAIVISEEFGSAKPAERNYRHIENRWPGRHYVYVGNDLTKDFIAPNRLGWQTVCVRNDGTHVHPQELVGLPAAALPDHWIERLA